MKITNLSKRIPGNPYKSFGLFVVVFAISDRLQLIHNRITLTFLIATAIG